MIRAVLLLYIYTVCTGGLTPPTVIKDKCLVTEPCNLRLPTIYGYNSKNQGVNSHFGDSLNLTMCQSDLVSVESHLMLTRFNKNYLFHLRLNQTEKILETIQNSSFPSFLNLMMLNLTLQGLNLTSHKIKFFTMY